MNKTIQYTIASSMLAFALSFTNQVVADVFTFELPAGMACPDFDLTVEISTNDHRVVKEWTDVNGNPVRMLQAGKGNELNFINGNTGSSYSIKANGSVEQTTIHADGSLSVSVEGHNVLILFPTDHPSGPSTKQYIGHVVYSVDAAGIWTLQPVNGRTVDICAELSE